MPTAAEVKPHTERISGELDVIHIVIHSVIRLADQRQVCFSLASHSVNIIREVREA